MNSIQKQINEIEQRVRQEQGDVEQLKKALQRLRMQEFEEDLRESDNRQLLKG
jgi:TolA-binding protein